MAAMAVEVAASGAEPKTTAVPSGKNDDEGDYYQVKELTTV